LRETLQINPTNAAVSSLPQNCKIKKTSDGDILGNMKEFQANLGRLAYLSVCTHPDISFAIGLLSRVSKCPNQEHELLLTRCLQ
jgi:hypothetical protein